MPAGSPQACTADFTAALIGRDMEAALTLLTNNVVFWSAVLAGRPAS